MKQIILNSKDGKNSMVLKTDNTIKACSINKNDNSKESKLFNDIINLINEYENL